MNETHFISLAFYFVALIASFFAFFGRRDRIDTLATLLLQCGLLSHCLAIGLVIGSEQNLRLLSANSKISMVLLLVMLGYLVLQASFGLRYVMGFYLFIPLLTHVSSLFFVSNQSAMQAALDLNRSSHFGLFHGIFSLFALALLTLSFVSSVLYLLMEYRLEKKKFDFWFHRLPALNSLELMSYRTTLMGFLFLTLSILTGALGHHRSGSLLLRLGGYEWLMILVWLVYIFFFQVRYESGMVGGRLSWIALVAYTLQCIAMFFFLMGNHPF